MDRVNRENKKKNFITLIIEIILTVAICFGIAYNSFVGLSNQSYNFSNEVMTDYQTLTNDYIRDFKVLRMDAVTRIQEDLSFEEMQEWLQSKDQDYTDAIGKDVFDGFAFTYKGGYVHSWNYGDYSSYDPNSRPWYQTAAASHGEVAVVAPYVTFLSNTDFIENYDILRMSIVQKYNEEISFDYDLNVNEINALIAERNTIYKGTIAFLYDKDGYVLSSTSAAYYGHNINTADSVISKELTGTLQKRNYGFHRMTVRYVDGRMNLIYSQTDEDGKTLCMLVPFVEVFIRNFMFVLLLAVILIGIEIMYYYRNKMYFAHLEENKTALRIKNEELEAANRAKTEFLSRMSHELRTPLNALAGYSDLIRENVISGSQDQKMILQNLVYSDRASNYLLRIIDDILDIQNAEFGKIHIKKEVVDVESFVGNVVAIIQQEAEEKNIAFSYHRKDDLSDALMIDGVRLHQIVLNVLHNAVKFTPVGGKVSFLFELKRVSENSSQTRMSDRECSNESDSEHFNENEEDSNMDELKLVVKDTGIGMSKEFVEQQLFHIFAQENEGNTSPYEGCGIGMAITKQLLDLMNGTITCISEKNKGTEFTIIIKAERAKKNRRRRRERVEQPVYDLSGINVLLCEDNPMNQDMEKRLLENMKCNVDIADDGKIGLELFQKSREGQYDIVLMDIRMPNMDGIEAAKAIRALERSDAGSVPIVAVSANAFDEDVENSLAAGMNRHLAKPVSARILADVIAEYCKERA